MADQPPPIPAAAEIDARVEALMAEHDVPGLAVAVIDGGETVYMKAFGERKLDPEMPLQTDTVMYGASLTKFVFASYVMRLVEAGTLDLDTPMAAYFPAPVTDDEEWADLEGDSRIEALTLRHVLNHSTGWANYRFFPPGADEIDLEAKLRFFYEPGERYGYSGEAFILAQRMLEQGFGVELTEAMEAALFAPLGMERTSMIWQEAFLEDENFARGYSIEGENLGHNLQDNPRAAGSMDTTLEDYTAFTKAFLAGEIVSRETMDEMLRPQLAITSDTQFPTLTRGSNPARNRAVNLSVGLGVVVWDGPSGHGFMKGGHNEKTDNMMLCLSEHDRCFIALMNTAKGDLVYPQLAEFILGDTGFPWVWEYGPPD